MSVIKQWNGAAWVEISSGVLYGNTEGTACEGDDSRLSDARTPTAHASTHSSGQADAISPANIGAEPAQTAASQAEAEAGTSTTVRSWTPQRVAQAAAAKFTKEYDNGTLGATKTLDPTNGEFQKAVLGANCTVSLTAPAAGYGARISFRWTISGGPYEITWPSTGFRWLSDTKPLLSVSPGRENLVVLSYTPSGWMAFGGSCVDINPVNLVPEDGSLLMTEDGIYWGVAQL